MIYEMCVCVYAYVRHAYMVLISPSLQNFRQHAILYVYISTYRCIYTRIYMYVPSHKLATYLYCDAVYTYTYERTHACVYTAPRHWIMAKSGENVCIQLTDPTSFDIPTHMYLYMYTYTCLHICTRPSCLPSLHPSFFAIVSDSIICYTLVCYGPHTNICNINGYVYSL